MLFIVPGFAAQYFVPWRFTEYTDGFYIIFMGLKLLVVSLLINLFALQAFRRHETPYAPGAEPETLIETGVFVISRHPVYLALVMATAGMGFVLDTVWIFWGAIFLFTALDRCVIPREEKRLELKFPQRYAEYRARTGRWIG